MKYLGRLAFAAFVAAFIASAAANALADDPPSRVARLSFTSGEVSMQPGGVNDWAAAVLNRPFTTADRLWTDQSSRAELQLGSAAVRMDSQTSLTFTNLADNVLQLELDQGTLDLHVVRLMDGEIYEVDTPNAAFTVLKPGDYRFDVDSQGDATLATVWRGKLVATGQGPEVQIDSHHQAQFSSGQSMFHRMSKAPKFDPFDEWCRVRDEREARVVSVRYVSPEVIGYEDLDGYGTWRELPQYGGPVWFPAVEAGWAPYHYGHWIWVEPWGWTWVDNASWGFAPFHYGRWVFFLGRWGWVPGPARVRPVYAPALVVWAGGNAGGVAWFPLCYGEPYIPYYHVSRNYFETVNVSNTRITNITYVTNTYYNNHNVQITNIHYRNEAVPGAVIMVHNETIVNAQPVDRDRIAIHGGEWRGNGVLAGPPVPPSTESVLGTHRSGPIARPIVEHPHVVVVKQAPPPQRVPFEVRRGVIADNAGRPLDRDEEQRLRAQHPTPAWNNARDDNRADHADNDARHDRPFGANQGNAPEHGDDAHRPAPQDNPAAHQPGDHGIDREHSDNGNHNGEDRGMSDNGRRGFPAPPGRGWGHSQPVSTNPSTNGNAGQTPSSNSDRGAGAQGDRGPWRGPDRPGNSAQSAPAQANPVQTGDDRPEHVAHRPFAGSDRSEDRDQDRSQGNNQNRNNAAQPQTPAQENPRHGWGAGNPPQVQPAVQSPAQPQAQPSVPSESNSARERVVPRPPFGRGASSEPVSQPAQSQPQPSPSPVMNNGHSSAPMMQPPMQQQNNAPLGRNVPHPPEMNHGFSAPAQQQPAVTPARAVEQPASRPVPPPQHNPASTPTPAQQSASPAFVRTAEGHGSNRAPAPQPQSRTSSPANGHGDKSQKSSGPQH